MAAIRRRPQSDKSNDITSRSALISTVHEVESKLSALLHWDDLPPWRRDNAYLLTSYRHPTASIRSVIKSALTIHNETVNIWSHLLAAVFFVGASRWSYTVVRPRYETSANKSDVVVFAAFFGGAVACLAMSATYHAVSSHSERVSRVGNKLDYGGIVVLTVGSFMPALYYGLFCRRALMIAYMLMIAWFGLACSVFACADMFRTPAWRLYRASMFVALGLSGVIPVLHGLALDGPRVMDQRMGLRYVALEAGLYIFGAGLYVLRWPERSFPRTFDILGSSHQLFHICVVVAAISHLYGMSKAFDHHHTEMGATCT